MSRESAYGLLNIHKPAGPTSHDIVEQVRRGTGIRKVGHAGTLDPLASGVLVLCLGPATRLSEYVMRSPKQYRAYIRLGITTASYDLESEIIERRPVARLDAADVEAALPAFVGDIDQFPPMHSAIQRNGRRLYDLARAGEVVTLEPRPVTIYDLRLVECNLPDLVLDVTCSPGTYIRSLAHDLGQRLGVGGALTGLVRVASGAFHIDQAIPMADFATALASHTWRRYILPPDMALADLPPLTLDADGAARVAHGNSVPAAEGDAGEARAYGPDGRLLALVRAAGGRWHPVKVFLPE